MITQLEGELVNSGVDWVDLQLIGVTLRVFVPENTVDGRNLNDGKLRLYTVFVIKDDSPILYGFKDSETRSVFDSLNKVSLRLIFLSSPSPFMITFTALPPDTPSTSIFFKAS